MFNRNNENPIGNVFKDLSKNQKISVLNLLMTIGVCDGEQGDEDKELQYLGTYAKALNVRDSESMPYLETHGHKRIFEDLQPLTKSQKEFLIVSAWEMITCDGKPNETELKVALSMLGQIGVSEQEFLSTIQKTQALMKKFSGR